MRQFDLIVFDWDGTLMDSERKIVNCIRAAALDCGLAPPTPAAARHIIGLGLEEALARLFPTLDVAAKSQLIAAYRDHFLVKDSTETPLFEGVIEGLQTLHHYGYRMAVATGKARRGLERVLSLTGTGHWFCSTRCADEAGSKPHPQMLHDILAATGVAPARALMIGDTTYDLQMARNAGLAALGVSYGVHERAALMACEPLAIMDSFPEIPAWLTRARTASAPARN